eukprot:15430526-Alexandrium_andersonii.AAC.1
MTCALQHARTIIFEQSLASSCTWGPCPKMCRPRLRQPRATHCQLHPTAGTRHHAPATAGSPEPNKWLWWTA